LKAYKIKSYKNKWYQKVDRYRKDQCMEEAGIAGFIGRLQ
jgi:hypothetical protein